MLWERPKARNFRARRRIALAVVSNSAATLWIPAFAGMTVKVVDGGAIIVRSA